MLKEMTVNAILDYIEKNIEVTLIDINSLVVYSGYSRRYLQQLFRQYVGIPVGKYIQRRRVTRAAVFLQLTSLSIISISERLCYDSQQTFTREFKKNTGFTPLQYRKNKVWTFRNQTGHRYLNSLFPVPEIRYLECLEIYGISVNYGEVIPFTGINSQQKWNAVRSFFTRNEGPLFISNNVKAGKINKNIFSIQSIICINSGSSKVRCSVKKGCYAYFTYNGKFKDYTFYINNIYMNVLPYYGLQRKNMNDLEIISKKINGDFYFEYYLPVYDEDNDMVFNSH
ncbi:TPA: helix-turn-helix transcriptional regulator [Escherichia coli]|nr:helix-turn-helix transcriptional regulator [Escherichia coli]HAW2557468.1 helix-turn-helix transcriptional regulator [Escherichia coli]HAW2582012.1 helix-turn-helix transcriptional regulator [Escherichia coli]